MTRRRVLMVVLLGLAIVGMLRSPSPVLADTVPGYPTPGGCVQGWTAFSMPYTSSVSVVTIRFHLVVTGSSGATTVQGRWETAEWNGISTYWRSQAGGANSQWFATDTDYPALRLRLAGGASPGGWLRFGLRVADGHGCFWVDSIVVTRFSGSGEGSPPTPTPPSGSPSPTPSHGAGPTASAPSGWCSVYDGSNWEWVPCTAATPSPTPSPSPSPSAGGPTPTPGEVGECPAPFTGPGTFVFHERWLAEKCQVWKVTTVQSGTTVSASWSGSSWMNTAAGNWNGPGLLIHTSGDDSGVWNNSISCGATVIGNFVFSPSGRSGWYPVTCNGGNFSLTGLGSGLIVRISTGATNDGSGYVGLDGTLTVTVTGLASPTPSPSPTPEPTPSPSPVPDPSFAAFCEANPQSWLCASPPPGWESPPPSPPPGVLEPWVPVDICPPGSTAAGAIACSTWPPSAPPDAPLPTMAGVAVPGEGAVASLVAALEDKAPFAYVIEGAEAIGGLAGSAPGAAPEWCIDIPRWIGPGSTATSHWCLPAGDMAGIAAPMRFVFLGILTVMFVVTMLRYAYGAAVGGGD